jgi:hypothetical protein
MTDPSIHISYAFLYFCVLFIHAVKLGKRKCHVCASLRLIRGNNLCWIQLNVETDTCGMNDQCLTTKLCSSYPITLTEMRF